MARSRSAETVGRRKGNGYPKIARVFVEGNLSTSLENTKGIAVRL